MPAKVMIGLPTARRIHVQALATLHDMIRSTREAVEVRVVQRAGSPVDIVRNKLVTQFLDMPGYTHLLFVDNDQAFPADGLDKLLRLDAPVAGVVCPIMRTRVSRTDGSDRLNLSTAVGQYVDERYREDPPAPDVKDVHYRWHDLHELDAGPVQCDAVGTGFMLIRRDVLELLEPPWFQVMMDNDFKIISEDVYFCRKVRQQGLSLVADPTALCDHFKTLDLARIEELFSDEQMGWPWAEGPIAPLTDEQPNVMIGTVGSDEWLNVDVSDFVYQQLTTPAARVSKVSYNYGTDLVQACNRVFDEFLDQSACSHLLVHSDDIGPPPDFLVRALSAQVPVAAACCRMVQDAQVLYEAGAVDDFGRVTPLDQIDSERREGPSEVDVVGLSATLFAREPLASLSRPILAPAETLLEAGVRLCQRLTAEAGIKPTLLPVPCHSYVEVGLAPLIRLKSQLQQQALATASA